MTRFHRPESLHLTDRFMEVFEHILKTHAEPEPTYRTVQAAPDWDGWSWEKNGGQH